MPTSKLPDKTRAQPSGPARDALHRLARYRPDRFTLLLAAFALLSAALVLLRGAAYGVGLQIDSASLISDARNLAEGNGFVQWNGDLYKYAPPLFPLTLAFAGLFGLDAVAAAGYVNAAAFGLTVFATAMWLRSRVRSRFLVVWAGGVCALAPPLTFFAAEAMTETLFILFVVLSLFALDRFLEGGKPLPLYLAASCAALASAARHSGIALAAAGALLLLLRRGSALPPRVYNAALFSIVATAPIYLWILRNFLASKPLVEGSAPAFAILASLHNAAVEFLKWSLGESGFLYLQKAAAAVFSIEIASNAGAGSVSLKIAILLVLALGTGLAIRLLRRQGHLPSWRILAVPVVFAAVYALFLAIVLPPNGLLLHKRFLAPLYVPALVAAAAVLNEFLRCAAAKGGTAVWSRLQPFRRKESKGWAAAAPRNAPAFLLKACLCLWLAQQIPANSSDIGRRIANGSGYASRQWADSDVVRYLKSRPRGGCIWSTDARALYFLVDPRPEYRSLPPNRLPDDPARRWRCKGEQRFVWFYQQGRLRYGHPLRYNYDLEQLAALPILEIEAALQDGMIFKVNDGKDAGGVRGAAQGGALKKAIREGVLSNARSVIRADFDVYLNEKANKLIYLKETCGGNDLEPRFFLHVVPENSTDLPRRRRPHAFDNLNFAFSEYGFEAAGLCAAARNLPDYAIAAIETGQFLSPENRKIWQGEFRAD